MIKEEPALKLASALRIQINQALATLKLIASGKDLKKFLWVGSFFTWNKEPCSSCLQVRLYMFLN